MGHDNAGCPRVEELTWEEDGPEGPFTVREGYWTPAACDDAFLARAPWGNPVEPLAQSDDPKPPQALVDLEYRGFAVLRHDPEDPALSSLEFLDRTGGFLDGETVVHGSATLREPPQLQVVWPEDLAVVALPASGQSLLEVTRYNADEGILYPTATWSAATLEALHLEVDPASFLIRTAWNAAGELNAVVQLRDTESLETGLYVFALTAIDDTITIERHHSLGVRTDRIFHLEAFTASEIRTLALVRLDSVGEDTMTLGFHLFSDVGQPMDAWTVTLPADHVAEAAFHLSDGTWAIAGNTEAPTAGEPPFPACMAHVTDAVLPIPFVLRTDAIGVAGAPEYFGADGLFLGSSTDGAADRACGTRRHIWSAFGTGVYLSGTWDRAGYFCSPHIELMTEVLGEPLHACGIYVIRMSAPAPI